jgi:hypothetical protein
VTQLDAVIDAGVGLALEGNHPYYSLYNELTEVCHVVNRKTNAFPNDANQM